MQEADDLDLRGQALARIKKKREFAEHLVAYVLVNVLLIAIWAVTGAGFFWPIFVLLGWGIGAIGMAASCARARLLTGANGDRPTKVVASRVPVQEWCVR